MSTLKTKMFREPGNLSYKAENFESSGNKLEIYHDEDVKSRHFGNWVLTKDGKFQDCDTYIHILAQRNHIVLHDSVNSSLNEELKKLTRYRGTITDDGDGAAESFMEEDPQGSYVRYDDMMEIVSRFQTK